MKTALCLLLMMDVSGSIDDKEYKLQHEATANALITPPIRRSVDAGGMAVALIHWSTGQELKIPWTVLNSSGQLPALSAMIASLPRVESGSTAVGDALLYGASVMQQAPACTRYVIDISGDGEQNSGEAKAEIVVRALEQLNFEINAIVIEDEPNVLSYYRGVIGEAGFVMPATFETYEVAIRTKLTLEISGVSP